MAFNLAFDPGVKGNWRGLSAASNGLTFKGDYLIISSEWKDNSNEGLLKCYSNKGGERGTVAVKSIL